MIIGGSSVNSTLPANKIPKKKQFFTIRAVDAVNSKLQFTAPAYANFLATDYGQISAAGSHLAVNCIVEGGLFGNDSSFNGPYMHGVQGAFGCTLRNVRLDGYSSCGFAAFCDQVVYDNVTFVGYNGMSCARGTKKLTYRDCTARPRYTSSQQIAGYFEETPEHLVVENCLFAGGFVTFTSSGDAVKKTIIFKDNIIEYDGTNVAMSFYISNADGGRVLVEGCAIKHPGATNGSGRKSVVYARTSTDVIFRNVDFIGMDSDSVAIDVNGANVYRLRVENCHRPDGTGKALCGSSVLASGNTCIFKRDLEIEFAYGRKYVTWAPEEGYIRCRWQFTSCPIANLTMLTASRTSGEHLYECSLLRSGSGAGISYEAIVRQGYNTGPVVNVLASNVQNAAVSHALSGMTGTTWGLNITGGSTSDQMVAELNYRLMDANPSTSVTLL